MSLEDVKLENVEDEMCKCHTAIILMCISVIWQDKDFSCDSSRFILLNAYHKGTSSDQLPGAKWQTQLSST